MTKIKKVTGVQIALFQTFACLLIALSFNVPAQAALDVDKRDQCIIDLMPANADKRVSSAVMRVCVRRAGGWAREPTEAEEVFDNCLVSNVASGANKQAVNAAMRKCRKISKGPSLFEKLRYQD